MLFKHQYLKFAYLDIALVVSKMCRGNLTAGILAIGVIVVLISEIDTNCRTISAWIWYILSMSWYKKKYVMLQMEDYQGGVIQKGIWDVLQLWCCEKRSSSVGAIMHVFV